MSYADDIRRHKRLAILRHLAECSEYTSNASILGDVLRGVGLVASRDQIVTELTWLQDQSMIIMTDHQDFVVATATQDGVEVARGVTTHPGIQRPRARG